MRERSVFTPEVFSVPLLSLVSAHVNEGHQILGTHWSASSFEEARPAAWWTGMPGTRPAGARGEGGWDFGTQQCLEPALALHSLAAAFLPALCLSHVTQVRLMAGLLRLVGHEPNLLIIVKLECFLCKILVTFRSD